MKDDSLKTLVRYAMLIALTTVMTMVIQIPTVGTEGYLNLGDMVVFLAAFILGKKRWVYSRGFWFRSSRFNYWIYSLCTYYICGKGVRRVYCS